MKIYQLLKKDLATRNINDPLDGITSQCFLEGEFCERRLIYGSSS